MNTQTDRRSTWNTTIALGLIPLSGFAMDIFIPSLPQMARSFQTGPAGIQLSLSLFMVSYGLSQLLVGGLVDSYGRYRLTMASLLLFSLSSFVIAFTGSLQLLYAMRILQGFTVAMIIVSKRAYFVDQFEGAQLKKYTSLFSVIWAIAPIVAPFLGGYLQVKWGWTSNFYFLGGLGVAFFILELVYGRETLKARHPFQMRGIARVYGSMLQTKDFTSGMLILGLVYAMILLYGMVSPFLIENALHYPASVTGYLSLFSGVSVLTGGLTSRILIQRPFYKKLVWATGLQIASLVILIPATLNYQNLVTLMIFVFLLHSLGGFIFNILLSYCLIRFPQHAGKTGGLVGGGFSIVTAVLSSVLSGAFRHPSQTTLGIGYGVLAVGTLSLLLVTQWKAD